MSFSKTIAAAGNATKWEKVDWGFFVVVDGEIDALRIAYAQRNCPGGVQVKECPGGYMVTMFNADCSKGIDRS